MDYRRINVSHMDQLWELQKAYKDDIKEHAPGEKEREQLSKAIENEQIAF